jgi:hypothetical protein
MSQQHYATPEANLSETTGEFSDLLIPLLATRPWVKLCAILGFIFSGLSVLLGIGMIVGGSLFDNSVANASNNGLVAAPLGFLGVIYILLAIFYFIPSLYLFKFGSAISRAQVSRSVQDVVNALALQKSFWKFVGVVGLIMIIFMILGIASAIVIPMMM